MFDYLQKYQQVPADVRSKLDTPAIKAAIKRLEENYHLSLASLLIKLVVKDVQLSRLPFYLSENNGLSGEQAQKLAAEIQVQVLSAIRDYISAPLAAPVDINRLAKGPALNQPAPTAIAPNTNSHTDNLEIILNKLVSQQNLFKQPAELNRWRQAAKTFLLGVRNEKALNEFLARPFVGGGLGLSSEQIDRLRQMLLEARESLNQQTRQQVGVKPPVKPTDQLIAQSAVRDFESDLLASLRKIDNQPRPDLKTETELPAPAEPTEKLLPAAPAIAPAMPTPPVVAEPTATAPSAAPSPIIPKPQPAQTIAEPTIVVPVDRRATDNKTGNIRMDDVRFTPKTLTPIDELANINLKRFRYLGHNPEEQAQKVKDKLDMLGEYGYSKRLQGISAWRQSPLNRLYLQTGQHSIESGRSAEQLLAEQLGQDPDSLTFGEFVAIMKLNQQIRF